jgi:hypothetical protein
VKRYWQYGRKTSLIVKKIWKIQKKTENRYEKYGRKVCGNVK